MRFLTVTVIAALSAIAYAQDSSQLAQFSSDVALYVTATLEKEPDFLSFIAQVQSNPAEIAQLEALTQNPDAILTGGAAAVSSIIAAAPTNIQPFVTSILGVYSSIAIKDGVASATGTAATSQGTGESSSSTTSSSATASATGNAGSKIEMGIMAGSLMGVVGLMAAL